jgi:hypothetical protein
MLGLWVVSRGIPGTSSVPHYPARLWRGHETSEGRRDSLLHMTTSPKVQSARPLSSSPPSVSSGLGNGNGLGAQSGERENLGKFCTWGSILQCSPLRPQRGRIGEKLMGAGRKPLEFLALSKRGDLHLHLS